MEPINNPRRMWRQPMPCADELESIFHGDYRCMQIYKELIYRACNTDNSCIQLEVLVNGISRFKTAVLMRGQVLYGRNKFAKYLCMNDKTVDRACIKLAKVYKKVTMDRSPNWTIVTINNYEDVIGMSNQRPSSVQAVTTSYSDKSVETVRMKDKGECEWNSPYSRIPKNTDTVEQGVDESTEGMTLEEFIRTTIPPAQNQDGIE